MLRLAAFVTDFADQAVVLPLAVLVAVLLYASGWRRGALVWTAVIVGTFALMLLLKLIFGACGHRLAGGEIESPSGHTAAAGVIYGTIFAFATERLFGRTPLTLLAVLVVIAAVGVSRVLLGAHTVGEVMVGAGVGLAAAFLLLRGAGSPRQGKAVTFVLLPATALLFLLHGLHLPAEAAIRHVAGSAWPLSLCR